MNRLVACLLLTGSLLPGGAVAQSRSGLADAARAFDEAALRLDDDNAKASAVRKWTAPIKLAFIKGVRAPSLVEPTRLAIKQIAVEAGIEITDLAADDSNAAYRVTFDENESSGGKRNCLATASWKQWAINQAVLKINPAYGSSIDNCIVHEAMHSFGFLSHPHDSDSVLSYRYARRTLTALDLNLIHTLYDRRLTPGMKPAAASRLGCRILGERLGAAAADTDAVCRDRQGPMPPS